MNILVLLAHPQKGSFNHAIANTAVQSLKEAKAQVCFHDLYAEGFDPILPAEEIPREAVLPPIIAQHCEEVSTADGIIIVHPNWWGQPPAILKGWVDRVIRPGVAYEFLDNDSGEGVPRGLLRAKAVLVLNTSNTETQREQEVFGDPLERIWRHCIFDLCGVRNFHRRMFNILVVSSEAQRRVWLDETRQLVTNMMAQIKESQP
ncbi:MAG: NAD(P)H-dependent oxidoreductase [Sedimentisphaerales bacterium]|nr:NAD(P)H-dependent oxidoreductase [Sedimentisphaerales bacterium]